MPVDTMLPVVRYRDGYLFRPALSCLLCFGRSRSWKFVREVVVVHKPAMTGFPQYLVAVKIERSRYYKVRRSRMRSDLANFIGSIPDSLVGCQS